MLVKVIVWFHLFEILAFSCVQGKVGDMMTKSMPSATAVCRMCQKSRGCRVVPRVCVDGDRGGEEIAVKTSRCRKLPFFRAFHTLGQRVVTQKSLSFSLLPFRTLAGAQHSANSFSLSIYACTRDTDMFFCML